MLQSYKTQNNEVKGENTHGSSLQDIGNNKVNDNMRI